MSFFKNLFHKNLYIWHIVPIFSFLISLLFMGIESFSFFLGLIFIPALAIVFAGILIVDFVLLSKYLLRNRRQKSQSPRHKYLAITAWTILALMIVGSIIWGVATLIQNYNNAHTSEEKALQLIRSCEITYLEQEEDGILAVVRDGNLHVENANWDVLVSEVNSQVGKCGFVQADNLRVQNTWILPSEALDYLSKCEIREVLTYEFWKNNGIVEGLEDPAGEQVTGLVLSDHGNMHQLYISVGQKASLRGAVIEAKQKCNTNIKDFMIGT